VLRGEREREKGGVTGKGERGRGTGGEGEKGKGKGGGERAGREG